MLTRSRRYDAFISYSHRQDQRLAEALHEELQSFARPMLRPRALRVFRDKTSLAASPALWPEIQRALAASEWFVLMASPESAESTWVQAEVQWWLDHRPAERMLLVCTAGHLAWRGGDFDWAVTDAVPRRLAGVFRHEPLWLDLRTGHDRQGIDVTPVAQLGDVVADLAAPIRGQDKDRLVGRHLRLRRRIRTAVAGTMSVLSVLVLVSSLLAVVASRQRDRAEDQTTIAEARQLAAVALANLRSRADLGKLLAVQAFQVQDLPETRSALLQAATSSPQLTHVVPSSAPVTALEVSPDESVAAAVAADGTVSVLDPAGTVRWSTRTGFRSVTAASVADGGARVAVSDETSVIVRDPGGEVRRIRTTLPVERVALSPSGDRVAIIERDAAGNRYFLQIVEVGSGRRVGRTGIGSVSADHVAMPTEELVRIAAGVGQVLEFEVADLRPRTVRAPADVPANGFLSAVSSDARYYGYAKLGLVALSGPDGSEATATVPVGSVEAVAIRSDGRTVAVAQSGAIYVTGVEGPAGQPAPVVTTLQGASRIGVLRFIGNRLLAAVQGGVQVWDPASLLARLATDTGVQNADDVGYLEQPAVAVSPDGGRAAVLAEDSGLTVVDLRARRVVASTATDAETGAMPVWSPDGGRLALVGDSRSGLLYDSSGRRLDADGATGSQVDWSGGGRVVTARWTPRGLISVDASSVITIQDTVGSAPRRVRRSTTGAAETAVAAIRPDGGLVALYGPMRNSLTLVDVATGQEITRPSDSPPVQLHFGDEGLYVERADNLVDIRDMEGMRVLRQSATGTGSFASSLSTAAGLIATVGLDGQVRLRYVESEETLGDIALPGPTGVGPGSSSGTGTAIALSGDGTTLLTATSGGSVLLWSLDPADWVRSVCATVGRSLATAEWERYVGGTPRAPLACAR